mmetsp:Transcript_24396/g.57385  ORF Transcript_24396/g.57385 Transcript_24396/m.57385 type:complete len:92 (-) Transcript_24396:1591-1866(-)
MSESLMVDNLWATDIVVMLRPMVALADSRVACTMRSDSLSKAEVASSKSKTCGFFARARAMATRCRCPPDSRPPPVPTHVSRPSGSCITVS